MTSVPTVPTAIEAVNLGAYRYVVKTDSLVEELCAIIEQAVKEPGRTWMTITATPGDITNKTGEFAMSTFQRRIRGNFMNQLDSDSALGEYPWLRDMLRLWRPAGDLLGNPRKEQTSSEAHGSALSELPTHLRLAIRDGYINLYRDGQSVAKIALNRKRKIQAKIHNKYVGGDEMKGGYTTLTNAGLEDPVTGRLVPYQGTTQLNEWIERANRHRGDEKRFVDLVVARNPNVIDLEMGLPAYSMSPDERRAVKMDLVALELTKQGWRIMFWEVKLAADSRARCEGVVIPGQKPEVLKQMADYTKWLGPKKYRDLVALEYENACRLLVKLHIIAKRLNPDIQELGMGIQAVAADGAQPLLVDDKPRLLIDGRDPILTRSFIDNGHWDKLRETGLHVQMVQSDDDMVLETHS